METSCKEVAQGAALCHEALLKVRARSVGCSQRPLTCILRGEEGERDEGWESMWVKLPSQSESVIRKLLLAAPDLHPARGVDAMEETNGSAAGVRAWV